MAALHVGKEVIVSLDIQDFFHSIKQEGLYELFLSLGVSEKPARTLSEICTYKSFVPQGALTSPKVANIVTAVSFGPPIKEFCDANGYTLSIYADDVTISSTNPSTNVGEIISVVSTAIHNAGFRVNRKKTKVMWKTSRQYVCGVVVNSKTNMQKKDRYKLRAIVHNITKNGLDAEAEKNRTDAGTFSSHIKGRLNWLKQLNQPMGIKYSDKLSEYLSHLPPPVTTSSPTTEEVVETSTPTEAPW